MAGAWVARDPPQHGFVAHLSATAPQGRHLLVACRSDRKSGNAFQLRDCRKGHLISFQGTPYEILDCLPGYSESSVTLKLRNLELGTISMQKFRDGAKLEQISAIQKTAIYTHYDEVAKTYVFLESQTFQEIHISPTVVGDMSSYLNAGMEVDLSMYHDKTITFGLNTKFVAEVVSWSSKNTPSPKGLTHKRFARLSNGKSVVVPMHIKIGDKVQVDSRTGDYVRRL